MDDTRPAADGHVRKTEGRAHRSMCTKKGLARACLCFDEEWWWGGIAGGAQEGSMGLTTASDQQDTTTFWTWPHTPDSKLPWTPLAARRGLCPEPHSQVCPSLSASPPTALGAGLFWSPPYGSTQASPSPGSPSWAWLLHHLELLPHLQKLPAAPPRCPHPSPAPLSFSNLHGSLDLLCVLQSLTQVLFS